MINQTDETLKTWAVLPEKPVPSCTPGNGTSVLLLSGWDKFYFYRAIADYLHIRFDASLDVIDGVVAVFCGRPVGRIMVWSMGDGLCIVVSDELNEPKIIKELICYITDQLIMNSEEQIEGTNDN